MFMLIFEGQDDVEEVLSISDSDSIRSDTEQSDTTPPSHIIVLEIYCHHHIRNVWWGALVKKTTNMLRTALAGSLDDIDSRLCVDTNMKNVFCALDKCFSLPANYPKGNGAEFKH